VHNAVIGACTQFGDYGRIKEQIIYLRGAYDTQSEVPPNFDDDATRLAYAVAYHPGHAYTYLSLLVRKTLGDAAFGGVTGSPTVLILGAGPGAETLAILRWMEAVRPELLDGARFVMVDRAEWQSTRRSVLAPTVSQTWKDHGVRFHQQTADITTAAGRDYLKREVPSADVIVCPSIVSEVITDGMDKDLQGWIVPYVSSGSRLVLVDHTTERYKHVAKQWSHALSVVGEGETGGFSLPSTPAWIRENLLDRSAPKLVPKESYKMTWSVLTPS
jgi:hypothetical protein